MSKGYTRAATKVHFMHYHFVWSPKYRRPVLVGNVETRLKGLILEKAIELGCTIIALEVMPDHVHLFLQADPTISPNKIVGMIKGYSSRVLRKEFPELRSRLPTLWTRSYFVSTHGHVSSDTIKRYVEEQKSV
ncbi:MAG: IS200/IS605 family transposase [Nitrososphaerota archaeon]|nr:IS200/IS605 family transposase [Nitrososphaerota archaeon]